MNIDIRIVGCKFAEKGLAPLQYLRIFAVKSKFEQSGNSI